MALAVPVYDVRNFGGVDGASVNAALLRVVQAARGQPADVVFPAGRYLLTGGGVTLSGLNGVRFLAQPGARFIAAAKGTQHAGGITPAPLKLRACTGVEFVGFEVDGGRFDNACFNLEACSGCVVRDNTFRRANSFGGHVNSIGGRGNRYLGNKVIGSGWNGQPSRGLWLGHYNTSSEMENGAVVEGNTVQDCHATGIICFGAGNVIRGNTSRRNKGSGVITTGAFGRKQTNTLIEGNTCVGNYFHGIQGDGQPDSPSVTGTIRNNTCSGNRMSGIYALRMQGYRIEGNKCSGNSTGTSGSAGIVVIDSSDVVVAGNECWANPQRHGVTVDGNGFKNYRIVIENNRLHDHPNYGVFLQQSGFGVISGVTIRTNHIWNNQGGSVIISGRTSGVTQSGNVFAAPA